MTIGVAAQAMLCGFLGGMVATYLIKRQRAKLPPPEAVSGNLDEWVKLSETPPGWGDVVGRIVHLDDDDDDRVVVAWTNEETSWERKASLIKVTDPDEPLRKNEPDPQ